MLPWFTMNNARVRAWREQHRYTPDAPAPDILAVMEFWSMVSCGDIERWSLSQLAKRWCWGRKRVKRLIEEWAEEARLHGWEEHCHDETLHVGPVLERYGLLAAPRSRPDDAPVVPRPRPDDAPGDDPEGEQEADQGGSEARPAKSEELRMFAERGAPPAPRECPGDAPPAPRSASRDETESRPASYARAPARSSSDSNKDRDKGENTLQAPSWLTRSACGSHDRAAVFTTVVRCIESITGRPVLPLRCKAAGKRVVGLWRELGRPDLDAFAADVALVARWAQESPDPKAAREIRAEGWADGTDRSREVPHICRLSGPASSSGLGFEARLELAQAWAAAGFSLAPVGPPARRDQSQPRRPRQDHSSPEDFLARHLASKEAPRPNLAAFPGGRHG